MTLDLPALESWLWEAACIIRGPVDAPKFKDYILSPSGYVSVGEQAEVLPLDEAVAELREAEEELETANRELEKVLKKLGLA